MSKMKSMMGILAAFAMMGSSQGASSLASDVTGSLWFENPSQFRHNMSELRKERLLKRGCRSFWIGGINIIAMNQKNADRKYELNNS